MERTECRGRRSVRPGDDDTGCVHLHDHRYSALHERHGHSDGDRDDGRGCRHRRRDHLVQQWRGHGPVRSAWRKPRCRRQLDDSNGIAHSGTFTPGTDVAGVYTYALAAQAPCPGDESIVTVTVVTAADAGTNGSIAVCDVGGAISLFAQLGGAPRREAHGAARARWWVVSTTQRR